MRNRLGTFAFHALEALRATALEADHDPQLVLPGRRVAGGPLLAAGRRAGGKHQESRDKPGSAAAFNHRRAAGPVGKAHRRIALSAHRSSPFGREVSLPQDRSEARKRITVLRSRKPLGPPATPWNVSRIASSQQSG